MWKKFCNRLLYQWLGWTVNVTEAHPEKCIICLAPHTSNWDFVIGQLYNGAAGLRSNFLMKKEWFFWPLGSIFKKMGGIPVYRAKHTSMTEAMAQTARQTAHFRLCITPEGTRKPVAEWKKGFYYIALGAKLPILLYGIDYDRKLIQCTKTLIPTGDIEQDMREIKRYFKDFRGKRPENFTTGESL